ncbi:MAG TPA: PD-(D/E)XK nuclease family protein, partial [Clostridiales bacterium]|nr:PD-(D/E)XK nuclease family protein [Clostridiales bacterium]
PNPEQTAEIKHRLSYRYPFEKLATTLSKRAASALQEGSFDTRYFAKAKPEFLSKSGLTPSERGTCLHKFMQYADFQTAERNPQEALDRLVEQAFLTETEAAAIETEVISGFFKSALYRRIKQSPALYREKKFAILEKAGTLDPGLPEALGEEKVMIQGIVDCAFEEDGKLVILDYKTDRVTTPEQLTERYKDQLQTYRKALSRCMGKEVKEAYLFSFALGKEIKVE